MFYHLGGGVHVKLESPYMVVHIRKYYLSKDDQFFPTSTGVAMRWISWFENGYEYDQFYSKAGDDNILLDVTK